MVNHEERELSPPFFRHPLHDFKFSLHRIASGDPSETGACPQNMGIDRDGWQTKCLVEDDIRRFPPDTSKLDQIIHLPGYLAAMALGDDLAAGANRFGFLAIESERIDDFLDIPLSRGRKCFSRRILAKQRRRNLIDPHVGTLGRENGGNEQL
jgi:hypothetical protein